MHSIELLKKENWSIYIESAKKCSLYCSCEAEGDKGHNVSAFIWDTPVANKILTMELRRWYSFRI